MLTALTAAALAAAPLTLFVETVRTEARDAQKAKIWTQLLADELRARGLRVTTQAELAELITGAKQQQSMGCDDADCGLDRDILDKADGRISALIAGENDYLVSINAHRRGQLQAWGSAIGDHSYADPADGLRELLPRVLDQMRETAEPGQLPDAKPGASEPKGAQVNRRCAAAPGPLALALLAALLWRRRSWKWRAGAL